MTRPKIKDKLPEKLPPVEPDEKKEMEVTGEKVGAPIEENFVSVDELKAETFPEEDPKPKHGVSHDSCIEEMEASAKPAQPDKYPSHAGKKEEQPFLFGEADQILNALETELSTWRNALEKLHEARGRIEDKMEVAADRIQILTNAIHATRKHAPMKEEPAPLETKPEPETTTPSDDPAPEALISSGEAKLEKELIEQQKETNKALAPGAAERNKATEDLAVKFRTPTQPLPDLLFPGDILVTSWETGPYRVEKIAGPYKEVDDLQRGGMLPSPDHYSIQCSDVDAKRNKDGRLAKNYAYSYLNMVIAVSNRFLSVYADSQDEVVLTGEGVDKKKDISKQEPDPKQEPVEAKKPEEEIY